MFNNKARHYQDTIAASIRLGGLMMLLALLVPINIIAQTSHKNFTDADVNITLNTKIYTINAINTGRDANTQRGSIYANGSTLARTTSPNAEAQTNQFVFVTPSNDNTSEVYLYSVSEKKFAKYNGNSQSITLVEGSGSPSQIYVYSTGDTTYPYAFTFASTIHNTNRGNADAVISISGGTLRTLDYSIYDNGNRWNLGSPTSSDFSSDALAEARTILAQAWLSNFHYKGISGRNFQANGMQSVAEVNYYYYVDTNRREYNRGSGKPAIDLRLPLMRYLARNSSGGIINLNNGTGELTRDNHESDGNNMEPMGYFRWYDYRTDGMPILDRVKPWNDWNNHNINILTEKRDKTGKSLGYFGLDVNDHLGGRLGPCADNIGAYYNIPDSADDPNWRGDIIACDVSRYVDYNDSETMDVNTFTHEPTLSVRYIFHILPAASIATEMRDSVLSSNRTIGDKGILVFGALDGNSTLDLRTNLQRYTQYYFYPLTADALKTKHIYHPENETSHNFADGDFSSQITHATAVEWRVYNEEMNAYRVIAMTDNPYFNDMAVRINAGSDDASRVYGLRGGDWKDLNGESTTNHDSEIDKGRTCYIVGYVTDGTSTNECPFFNAQLDITGTYPKSLDQINADNDAPRTDTYLATNFGSPVATFSFDTENSEQNYNAPTDVNADDNLSSIPSPFAQRQYSFVYYKLGTYSQLSHYNVPSKTYTPLHGDFCLYKEYGPVKNDRTYVKTNGSQHGYFMFTDASDESRMLGYQDFVGSLCAGSQIILSAWVSNTSGGTGSAQPELRFTLYGVNKDSQGNDVSTKMLGSICSGNFLNNIKDYNYNTGTWYQVYGVLTLPAETNVSQFRNFRIVIDNFCNNTSGADYAIDDINVYQSNSRLTVTQKPALCEDDNPNQIDLKIKGNYSVAKSLTEANSEDKTVYYRFYRTDGTPVTGTDFYGEGHDNYGVATVPHTVTNDTTKFELSLSGVQEVILANQKFNLKADTTYYAAVALENPDDASSWGRPSDICSFYSSNFSFIRQTVMITGSQTTTAQLQAACGETSITKYDPISLDITAPDQIAGGSTILTGIKFDYFLGTRTDMNNVKHGTSNLLQAIRHYRDHYPTVTDGTGDVVAATATDEGYSEDDKFLIDSCRYATDDAHKNGKLLLSASSSLSGIPLPVGRQSILAIPTEDEITVTINGRQFTYELCNDPSLIVVNVSRNGPGLVLGHPDVTYPSTEPYRSVRIGLPQIKSMGTTGTLRVPVSKRTFGGTNDDVPAEVLRFYNDIDSLNSTYLYIVATNDPTINTAENIKFAELDKDVLNSEVAGDSTLNIKNFQTSRIHEGYWYEVGFYFLRTDIESECPGETYLTFKIVPEYLTWYPTADNSLNSNWNNDLNWRRATAGELFNAAYKDYRTPTYQFQLHNADGNVVETKYNTNVDTNPLLVASTQPASYVPMYFSKVIIPSLSRRPYPMLGYVRYQDGTGIVMDMTNGKNHSATTNIQYDMEAYPIPAIGVDTSYWCSPYKANICEQIHFKTGAQLRDQQFLNYQKAWVELALPINMWGTFTTPMDHTIAGDMYVPKMTGAQTTPLFQDMLFTDVDAVDSDGKPYTGNGTMYGLYGKAGNTMYNRIRMPVYQKLWGENGNMYPGSTSTGAAYSSYDQPYMMLIQPSADAGYEQWTDMNNRDKMGTANVWSHTFNAVGVPPVRSQDHTAPQLRGIYKNAYGVAGKIGDDYTTPTANSGAWSGRYALMRLPKADASFKMYRIDSEGNMSDSPVDFDVTEQRQNNYRLGIPYNNVEGNLGEDSINTASLTPEPTYGYAWDDATNDFAYDEGGNIMFLDKDGNRTSTPTGLVYDLIGNPYTSAITIRDFIEANKSVLRTVLRDGKYVYRLWLLNGDQLVEYGPENINTVIDPGRAFFIPIQIAGRDVIHFTTNMEADPNIHLNTMSLAPAAMAPAKVYTLSDLSDVTNIINHGVDTQLYVWSPSAGIIAVSGESINRIDIYNVSGQLIQSADMTGTEKHFSTGTGVYIVKATLKNGKTQSQKIAVK